MIKISQHNPNKKYFNDYKILNEQESEFYIVNKKGEHFTVKVDTEDLYKLIKFNRSWNAKFANNSYYVSCCEYLTSVNGKAKYKIHYLERWVFGEPKSNIEIDHKNNDPLDNRKSNLRVANKITNAQNRGGKNRNNKSGYRNVFFDERVNKYIVQLQINGTNKRLGSFDDLNNVAQFAKSERQKYYGKFAGKS